MLKKLLEFSWAYELFQDLIGARRLRRIYINEYVKPLPGSRLLDVGCGPGVMVPYLKGTNYYGIDLNPKYIEKAQQKHTSEHVHFKCADVSSLDAMEKSSYDIIMMNGVLHHLDDIQADKCLAGIGSLLKPGGRFCSFDGVYDDKMNFAERFVLGNDRGKYVRTTEAYVALVKKYLPDSKWVVKRWLTNIPNPLIIFF